MGEQVREIRKEVNFSVAEYRQIQELMEGEGHEQSSPFVRGKLLNQKYHSNQQLEEWIKYWQHQKVEQIGRDIHEITVLANSTQSVTSEHLGIILNCVKELMNEIGNTIPLSGAFKDKYMW
ncbi:SAG1252 family conjugative relaxosome accessory protein [Streptococcus canis]|uniref:SAG1252 family conjugative relaxosome accessory protein n=1 Tax=Streptococcus canis TaxID=1329 RepID=UPI0012F03498|nr:SAG1252 family conjugative relaxosome accessory protein [Streptococcus canis]GFE44921.1 hypothetical protein ScFU6_06900 [Streptococcus canis]